MNLSIRQLLLALVFIGIVGLEIELALLRHAESFSQWIPHVVLIFLIVGVLGVYLHYRGNVEFALERDPSLTGARLLWKSLRGATPALAPGALSQLGLLGLLYSYRHPAFARDAARAENLD